MCPLDFHHLHILTLLIHCLICRAFCFHSILAFSSFSFVSRLLVDSIEGCMSDHLVFLLLIIVLLQRQEAWLQRDSSFHHFIRKSADREWVMWCIEWMKSRPRRRRDSKVIRMSLQTYNFFERRRRWWLGFHQFLDVCSYTVVRDTAWESPLISPLTERMDSSNLSKRGDHDDDDKRKDNALIPWLICLFCLLVWQDKLV